jgi:branched-chain amino acid transport system permease protein
MSINLISGNILNANLVRGANLAISSSLAGANLIFIDTVNGRVGVRTNAPAQALDVAGVRVSVATLIATVAALAIAAGLTLLLRHTQVGLQLRAMSERPVTAQLLGINTQRLAVIVWASTGVLSALAMLLIAPTRNPTFESMSFLIVPALAAALVGSFSHVWIATVAALLIGVVEGAASRIDWLSDYRGALPAVIILFALIWLRRREVWDAVR